MMMMLMMMDLPHPEPAEKGRQLISVCQTNSTVPSDASLGPELGGLASIQRSGLLMLMLHSAAKKKNQ